MIYRQTTVGLLVCVLLGCPFFCLLELGEEKGAEAAVLSCACCGLDSSDSLPSHDGSACGQQDCLCRGAIIFMRVAEGNVGVTPLWAVDHYLAVADAPVAQNAGEATLSSFHSPPFCSGRDIRALTGVLLL